MKKVFDSAYYPDEAITELCKSSVDYICSLAGKTALFQLKNTAFTINTDGTITSDCKLTVIDSHAFIQITTGDAEKKTINLLICLLDHCCSDVVWTLTRDASFLQRQENGLAVSMAKITVKDANNRSLDASDKGRGIDLLGGASSNFKERLYKRIHCGQLPTMPSQTCERKVT